ncbi:hypothetical protein MMC25_005503 [Agyrium rufum]|nr:hypothetical protein [Agyrium rufum]
MSGPIPSASEAAALQNLQQAGGSIVSQLRPMQACKRCRKRKAGCDRNIPSCSRCAGVREQCEYENVPRKKRKSPTGPRNIKTVEDRIVYIETCLKKSGMMSKQTKALLESVERPGRNLQNDTPEHESSSDSDSDYSSTDATDVRISLQVCKEKPITTIWSIAKTDCHRRDRERTSPHASPKTIESEKSFEEWVTHSSQAVGFGPRGSNRHRYWPSLSERLRGPLADLLFPKGVCSLTSLGEPVLSFKSPESIRWLCEKTNIPSAQSIVQIIGTCDETQRGTDSSTIFAHASTESFVTIPSRQDTLTILETYFKFCNPAYPLFEQGPFMHQVQQHLNGVQPSGPAWFACLNVALCIGLRVLESMGMTGTVNLPGREPSDFFNNAMKVAPSLLIHNPSVLGVQALIGLAIYIQTTENPDSSFSMLTIALRQIQQLYGNSIESEDETLCAANRRHIRRLFWLAFSLNTDTILQSGQPWIPSEADIDIEFLDEDFCSIDEGHRIIAPLQGEFSVFYARVRLAIIQSRVYSHLYSPNLRHQDLRTIRAVIADIDRSLRDWEFSILNVVRPPGSRLVQPTLLGLRYYNTLIMVNHMSTVCAYNSLVDMNENAYEGALDSRQRQIEFSMKTCVLGTRMTVKILQTLPNPTCKYALNRLVLNSALASFATLFANLLESPEDPLSCSDLEMMEFIIRLTSLFSQSDRFEKAINNVLHLCKEMAHVARQVVENRTSQHMMLEVPLTLSVVTNNLFPITTSAVTAPSLTDSLSSLSPTETPLHPGSGGSTTFPTPLHTTPVMASSGPPKHSDNEAQHYYQVQHDNIHYKSGISSAGIQGSLSSYEHQALSTPQHYPSINPFVPAHFYEKHCHGMDISAYDHMAFS